MKKLSGLELSPRALAAAGVLVLALVGFFAYSNLRESELPKPTKMPGWDTIHKSIKRQPSGFSGEKSGS